MDKHGGNVGKWSAMGISPKKSDDIKVSLLSGKFQKSDKTKSQCQLRTLRMALTVK